MDNFRMFYLRQAPPILAQNTLKTPN